MELRRLQEIVNSPAAVQVLHNLSPVWIESVDDQSAVVRYLETGKVQKVPVAELSEPAPNDLDDQYPDLPNSIGILPN